MLLNSSISTSIYNETNRATLSENNIAAIISGNETNMDTAITDGTMMLQALATLQEQYFSGNVSTLDALPGLADEAIVGATGGMYPEHVHVSMW